MNVFVLGLDGATWEILDPLIQDGLLPNLARLREQGSWGSLHSVFPPLSPVAWAGAMTGKNSGKHGIFEFIEHAHNPLVGRVNSSREIQSKLVVGDCSAIREEDSDRRRTDELSRTAC